MAPRMDARADATDGSRAAQPIAGRRPRRRTAGLVATHTGRLGEAALATLDKLNRGVLLVDADCTVEYANQAAQVMLARRDGLLLRRRKLRFESEDAHEALERYLASGDSVPDSPTLVLRVDGPRLQNPYRVLVTPVTPRSGQAPLAAASYCVFVYEPNGGQRPVPAQVLQGLYGLTAAEARLVNHLFLGRSLAEAADVSRITINTAKSMLKRIFLKCAVSSQAELLLLLSLGPRTL